MKDLLNLILNEIKNTPQNDLIKKTYEIDKHLDNFNYEDKFFEVFVASIEVSTTNDNFCYKISKNKEYQNKNNNTNIKNYDNYSLAA